MLHSRRTHLLAGMIAALLAPCALLAPLSHAQAGRPTTPPHWKNLQVLKKLPPDRLIPLMRQVSASLGVRCDFCHVVGPNHTGFEKDTRPEKRMARRMMVMTESLNRREKILDGKATCYMCHHGHEMPETKAPAAAPPAGHPAPRR